MVEFYKTNINPKNKRTGGINMLVTLKQCLDSVVEYEMQSRQIGNIKVERDEKK